MSSVTAGPWALIRAISERIPAAVYSCESQEVLINWDFCPQAHIPLFSQAPATAAGTNSGAGCTGQVPSSCKSQLVCEPEELSRTKPFPNWSPRCYPLPPSPVTGNGEQRFPPNVSVSNQILLQFFIDIIEAGQIFVSLINYNSGLWGKLSCLLTLHVGSRVDEGV